MRCAFLRRVKSIHAKSKTRHKSSALQPKDTTKAPTKENPSTAANATNQWQN